MRLRGERLKQLAADKGVSGEQLAEAVQRVGLSGDRAVSAIKNWMAGRDHPRCKKQDIDKLAVALGVQTRELARFTCQVVHHRGSPRKAKLVVDLIRGKSFDQAVNLLAFNTKRAAVNVKKALFAAQAEAQLADVDPGALFVAESRVDDGPRIKRFQPKDRGRAHPIIKRMSNITITLQERA